MGLKNEVEYIAWKSMKARCYSPCHVNTNYQKNKIKVCDEWKNSYNTFLKEMGKKPSDDYSLDRIDNLGDYTLLNCRWATSKIQTSNRGSFNDVVMYKGVSKTLKQWCIDLNLKYTTVYQRMKRTVISFEEAISKDPFNRKIYYKGK